jgi:hypothetical protein
VTKRSNQACGTISVYMKYTKQGCSTVIWERGPSRIRLIAGFTGICARSGFGDCPGSHKATKQASSHSPEHHTHSRYHGTGDDCSADSHLPRCPAGRSVTLVVKKPLACGYLRLCLGSVFPRIALSEGVELRDDDGLRYLCDSSPSVCVERSR